MAILLAFATVLLLWVGKLIPGFARAPHQESIALAGYTASLIVWFFALTRIPTSGLVRYFGSWENRWIAVGLGSAIVLFLASGVGYAVSGGVLDLTPPPEAGLRPGGFGTRWLLLVAMSVTAAALEEWLFRGLVLHGVGDDPAWFAVLLSAGAFASYHLSLFQLLPTFLLGVGLAVMVLRVESLWPAVLAHGAFNVIGLLLFTFQGSGR